MFFTSNLETSSAPHAPSVNAGTPCRHIASIEARSHGSVSTSSICKIFRNGTSKNRGLIDTRASKSNLGGGRYLRRRKQRSSKLLWTDARTYRSLKRRKSRKGREERMGITCFHSYSGPSPLQFGNGKGKCVQQILNGSEGEKKSNKVGYKL